MKTVNLVYDKNVVSLSVSCSNEYVPYLSVFLESIKQNADAKRNYDIVVFERSISEENKLKLCNRYNSNNMSLRFFNPSDYFKGKDLFVSRASFKEECYYRIAAPLIFKDYKKILFTDVDLVFDKDPALIYDIDTNNAEIAAVKDPIMSGYYKSDYKTEVYLKNVLCMSEPLEYLNTGVMLFNVEPYTKHKLFYKILEHCMKNHFKLQEQDGISSLLAHRVFKLPIICNYTPYNKEWSSDNIIDYMPENVQKEYISANGKAIIYHWAGESAKPWFYPEEVLADIWWQYARQTPFYEEILARLIDFKASKAQENISAVSAFRAEFAKVHFPNINNRFGAGEYNAKLSFVMNHLLHFRLKKFGYALKKAFAFGERYAKYNDKYQRTKQLIKDAKKLKKSYYKV